MRKRDGRCVLDVGQCQPDHAAIRELLVKRFGAEVDYAVDLEEACRRMRARRFDLVLVNRIIDSNGERGHGLIEIMARSPELRTVPVMLVSDFASAQEEALALGAVPGFGKSQLQDPHTAALLAGYLGAG